MCPLGAARMFDNLLRLLIHQPRRVLREYVKAGSKVLDFGCGLGFFSIAMAKMVGEGGLVIAADLQDVTLKGLTKRARRADGCSFWSPGPTRRGGVRQAARLSGGRRAQ